MKLIIALMLCLQFVRSSAASDTDPMGITVRDDILIALATRVAGRAGIVVAITPDVREARVSFSEPTPQPPQELFRRFCSAIEADGFRTLVLEDVAIIDRPGAALPITPPASMSLRLERINLIGAALQITRMTGRMIALDLTAGRHNLSLDVKDSTADQILDAFSESLVALGFRRVRAQGIDAFVPNKHGQ